MSLDAMIEASKTTATKGKGVRVKSAVAGSAQGAAKRMVQNKGNERAKRSAPISLAVSGKKISKPRAVQPVPVNTRQQPRVSALLAGNVRQHVRCMESKPGSLLLQGMRVHDDDPYLYPAPAGFKLVPIHQQAPYGAAPTLPRRGAAPRENIRDAMPVRDPDAPGKWKHDMHDPREGGPVKRQSAMRSVSAAASAGTKL